jgi:hypothetical protein
MAFVMQTKLSFAQSASTLQRPLCRRLQRHLTGQTVVERWKMSEENHREQYPAEDEAKTTEEREQVTQNQVRTSKRDWNAPQTMPIRNLHRQQDADRRQIVVGIVLKLLARIAQQLIKCRELFPDKKDRSCYLYRKQRYIGGQSWASVLGPMSVAGPSADIGERSALVRYSLNSGPSPRRSARPSGFDSRRRSQAAMVDDGGCLREDNVRRAQSPPTRSGYALNLLFTSGVAHSRRLRIASSTKPRACLASRASASAACARNSTAVSRSSAASMRDWACFRARDASCSLHSASVTSSRRARSAASARLSASFSLSRALLHSDWARASVSRA